MLKRFGSLLLCLLLTLALAACSSDSKPTPSPTAVTTTASTTSTTTAINCPVNADICSFGTTLQRPGQLDQAIDNARLTQYTCPGGTPQGAGGPFPLCDGAAAGEKRSGVAVAHLSSEGSVVSVQALHNDIKQWLTSQRANDSDIRGRGGNRLFSVGCPAGIVPCRDQYALVFSQLRGVPTRNEMILYFERQGSGNPQLVWVVMGPLLDPAQEQSVLRGGAVQDFLTPPGWPPLTTFYALP